MSSTSNVILLYATPATSSSSLPSTIMSTMLAVESMLNGADQVTPQSIPTDLICSYCPLYPTAHSPSPSVHSKRHQEARRHPSRGHRRHSSTIPLKRTMNLDLSQDNYDEPMSMQRFTPRGNYTEEAVASPIRDAFFVSNKTTQLPANDSGREFLGSFHRPRSSASTSTSASPDSSPTASTSVAESASTPGTSPDTPASNHSYTYPSLSSMAMQGFNENKSDFRLPPTPAHKKPRNLKNLAVNTSTAFPLAARAVSTASFPIDHSDGPLSSASLPFSPAFAPSGPGPRRRPSGPGLTIQTPAFDTFPRPKEIPQLPQVTRLARPETLRHFQSSPSLPLDSSDYAIDSPVRTEFARPPFVDDTTTKESQLPPSYDLPESMDNQPAAYPNGPICIYDPYVDLYFEPTADEASKYDVIVNVASEVKNPFRLIGDQNVNAIDLKAAVEALAGSPSSPSTPKPGAPPIHASNVFFSHRPEYIHIPWEHNTDIVPGTGDIPSLHDIIRLIDSRVNAGKRVLIHCQCGVSRSASLIVAYGLYKNPSITVQEAYDAVKQRSEWIGPNMNLIMQLQEFRNTLLDGRGPSMFLQGFPPQSNGKQAQSGALPGDVIPRTAPLPQPTSKHIPPPVQTRNLQDVSPGPSSAPSDFHHRSPQREDSLTPTNTAAPVSTETAVVIPTGQVLQKETEAPMPDQKQEEPSGNKKRLAIRTGIEAGVGLQPLVLPPQSLFLQQQQPLDTPRGAQFAMAPVRADEEDQMFGITSPRPIELTPPPTFSPSPTASPTSPTQDQLGGLSSPRATDFAMSSIYQPEFDQTFGLTSPRTTGFPSFITGSSAAPTAARFPALYPKEEVSAANVNARAELRAKLGLNSTRSNQDLRSGYNNLAVPIPNKSAPGNQAASVGLSVSVPESGGASDALMSPRATEFTSNPFQSMFGEEQSGDRQTIVSRPAGEASDPRSPPLKGGSPIVRNILDVL